MSLDREAFMERVGIYLRISDDRDGTQTATERQLEDCRSFAASRGWAVADVFEDVDLSAYKRTVKRPEFERMITAVADKGIDGVLAWKIDRLTRRQRDLVRLDEAAETAGGFIATVTENIDTRQPTGRFVAELLTAQARMESQNTSTRVTRAHEQMAKQGRPLTGGTRGYGYNVARTEILADEADLIREAARRVLAGESIRGICLDWERRGVKSPPGKTWKQTPLRRLLMNATLSGQREYQGALIPGNWPAILSADETARLQAVLGDPARRKNHGNARKYLLSGGFLRCGKCGSVLVARPRVDHVRRYVCNRQPGLDSHCGRLTRLAEPIEAVVTEAVFVALEGADIAAYMRLEEEQTDAALVASVRTDEAALEQLSRDHYADKVIGRVEYFAARDAIAERLERNRTALARRTNNGALQSAVDAGTALRELWPSQSLAWQRAVIGAVIDHVVVLPAVKGRNTFDPTLIKPVWKV
jgi:site-specific DNA recombinase